MSGTPNGKINGFISSTVANSEYKLAADTFKFLFDAVEANTNTTRVALQYGSGGTGTDYRDGANSFGQNAFAVWRWDTSAIRGWPFYMLLQTSSGNGGSASFGSSPGDPATHNGTTASSWGSVAVSFAIGVGGDEDAWNGNTANDGTDRKGGSSGYAAGNDGLGGVWRIPAGGTNVLVFPRSNNGSDTYNSVKQDMMRISNTNGAETARIDCIMDDDNFLCMFNASTDNTTAAGLFTPHAGLAVGRPFIAHRNGSLVPPYDLTSNSRNGGIAFPDETDGDPVRNFYLTPPTAWTAETEPNRILEPGEFEVTVFNARILDGSLNAIVGQWGRLDNATADIGAGANGTVTVRGSGQLIGAAGNSATVSVVVPGGTSSLSVSTTTTTVTVNLAVNAGVPIPAENTALLIAEAVSFTRDFRGVASGDGSASISAAEGPTSLTGGADNFFELVYGTRFDAHNPTRLRQVLGDGTTNQWKYFVHWDGVSQKNSNYTREGISF